jgi:predicted dinucleotide-binding enzyme
MYITLVTIIFILTIKNKAMKKFGVFGTGMVGNAIGKKLIDLGQQVMMGSRTIDNQKAIEWSNVNGNNASNGTFEDAAKFGDLIFNCTKGEIAIDVIKSAGIENFNGKTFIDISNPLEFQKDSAPILIPHYTNTTSLAEHIQNTIPAAHVVKTLNIVNCEVMVNPSKSGGDPTMFMSGNNADAKEEVRKILQSFGWNDIIDLGDITTARGTEMMLPIWLRTYIATKNPHIAFKIIRKI